MTIGTPTQFKDVKASRIAADVGCNIRHIYSPRQEIMKLSLFIRCMAAVLADSVAQLCGVLRSVAVVDRPDKLN